MKNYLGAMAPTLIFAGALAFAPAAGFGQIYNPYYVNPYAQAYASGYGYGATGYGGVHYYNYNAPYSHIYYSPTYSVQPRASYSVPYYYGGYYLDPPKGHSHHGRDISRKYPFYSGSSGSRADVPAGTAGWIPTPLTPRQQKTINQK